MKTWTGLWLLAGIAVNACGQEFEVDIQPAHAVITRTATGHLYNLERSATLSPPAWQVIDSFVGYGEPVVQMYTGSMHQVFYRAIEIDLLAHEAMPPGWMLDMDFPSLGPLPVGFLPNDQWFVVSDGPSALGTYTYSLVAPAQGELDLAFVLNPVAYDIHCDLNYATPTSGTAAVEVAWPVGNVATGLEDYVFTNLTGGVDAAPPFLWTGETVTLSSGALPATTYEIFGYGIAQAPPNAPVTFTYAKEAPGVAFWQVQEAGSHIDHWLIFESQTNGVLFLNDGGFAIGGTFVRSNVTAVAGTPPAAMAYGDRWVYTATGFGIDITYRIIEDGNAVESFVGGTQTVSYAYTAWPPHHAQLELDSVNLDELQFGFLTDTSGVAEGISPGGGSSIPGTFTFTPGP